MTIELATIREGLEDIVGKRNVSNNFFKISDYCMNHIAGKISALSKCEPFLVARPETVEQLAGVVQYACRERIPVYVRGGGSGYLGGEVPTAGGIVVETTGMDGIIDVDKESGYVTCEPGITVKALNEQLRKYGLWWPHDPGSRDWATVGGSIATLGGGAFSTKFGNAPNTVVAMKIVTPEGDIVRLGSKVRHDWSHYDLIDFIASGEGTLGVIAEATIKIFKIPQTRTVGLALFRKFEDAVTCCCKLTDAGLYPETLMMDDTLRFTLESIGPLIDLNSPAVKKLRLGSVEAVMAYGFAGSAEVVRSSMRIANRIVKGCRGRLIADKKIVSAYWRSKTELPSWSTEISDMKLHSFVPTIPLSRAADFHHKYAEFTENPKLRRIGARYYVTLLYQQCTVSPTAMYDDNDPAAVKAYEEFTRRFATEVVKMGGAPSSTLGVGMRLVDIVESLSDPSEMMLTKRIKRDLDPANVLNPGKKLKL